jgi:hypothetical protein
LKTVDLRSDTVTQPTPAMREAMMAAPLGDDVFGDDPSVHALQARIAAITGKEAALFMASGTQSNLCAMLSHCERGDEYIVGQNAHTYRYEGGGAAVLGSIQPQPLAQNAVGQMALADIAAAIKPDDPHFARTRLLCLENTWNGHPMTPAYLDEATALARVQRGGGGGWRSLRGGARHRRPLRQRLRVLQQRPGRARGFGPVRIERPCAAGASLAQDAGRRAAPVGPARGGGAPRAGPPCEPPC